MGYTSALQRAPFSLTVAVVTLTYVDKQPKITDDSIIQVLSFLFSCCLILLTIVTMRGQRAVKTVLMERKSNELTWSRFLIGQTTVLLTLSRNFRTLWYPEVRYRFHESSPLGLVLSQLNPVQSDPSHFFDTRFNIIITSI